jgi:acyl carrier protein
MPQRVLRVGIILTSQRNDSEYLLKDFLFSLSMTYMKGTEMTDSTFETVRRVLVDGLSVDAEAVSLESKLNEDLGADSLDAVELIMSLEDEFDVEVEPAQAESLKTVNDIVTLIDSLKA